MAEAGSDPDAYFEERGFFLRVDERNLDAELPPDASSRGWTHWADLVFARSGQVVAPNYGGGFSVEEAKASALHRWVVEQEPPSAEPQT
jgi:hypothetical protein